MQAVNPSAGSSSLLRFEMTFTKDASEAERRAAQAGGASPYQPIKRNLTMEVRIGNDLSTITYWSEFRGRTDCYRATFLDRGQVVKAISAFKQDGTIHESALVSGEPTRDAPVPYLAVV